MRICVCFVDISEFLALNKIQQAACRKAVTRHIISMEEGISSLGYNNGGRQRLSLNYPYLSTNGG